jgi:hypothetical protein
MAWASSRVHMKSSVPNDSIPKAISRVLMVHIPYWLWTNPTIPAPCTGQPWASHRGLNEVHPFVTLLLMALYRSLKFEQQCCSHRASPSLNGWGEPTGLSVREAVEVQDSGKISHYSSEICRISLESVTITTWNRLDLKGRGFWLIVPKNLPGHCLACSQFILECTSRVQNYGVWNLVTTAYNLQLRFVLLANLKVAPKCHRQVDTRFLTKIGSRSKF